MKEGREKLMSHILMVVAPLLMLLVVTVAWFISSHTAGLSQMSFASQGTGPGAVLHRSATLEKRIYTAGPPATLAYDITWGKEETVENSDVTVENIVPGQCEYYLLVSNRKFTPHLTGITLTDADGNPVTTPAGAAALPLAQCVGLYLIPTTVDLSKDPVNQIDPAATITLVRESAAGPLSAAVFKDATFTNGIASAVLPPPAVLANAYILAVYCDPIYGQNTPFHSDHVAALGGALSFSLAFDAVEG